jgi:hypothetical protein
VVSSELFKDLGRPANPSSSHFDINTNTALSESSGGLPGASVKPTHPGEVASSPIAKAGHPAPPKQAGLL